MTSTLEFDRAHPLTKLIMELEAETSVFCKKCPYKNECFDDVSFHLEAIEECGKLPTILKLYWKAKSKSIRAIAPLKIYQEE